MTEGWETEEEVGFIARGFSPPHGHQAMPLFKSGLAPEDFTYILKVKILKGCVFLNQSFYNFHPMAESNMTGRKEGGGAGGRGDEEERPYLLCCMDTQTENSVLIKQIAQNLLFRGVDFYMMKVRILFANIV